MPVLKGGGSQILRSGPKQVLSSERKAASAVSTADWDAPDGPPTDWLDMPPGEPGVLPRCIQAICFWSRKLGGGVFSRDGAGEPAMEAPKDANP